MALSAQFIELIAGTPIFGIWCDKCMTSAIIEVTFYSLQDDGVYKVFTSNFCHTCNSQ